MAIEESRRLRVRWRRVIVCTLAGVAAIRFTFVLAGPAATRDVLVSFMVEGSAALFLLAILFFLERSFTAEVTTTVVREVREQVTGPLEARVEGLVTDVATLQAEVDQRIQQQAVRHHDLVEALGRPTFESVTAALTEATRLNAIANGSLAVQAGPRVDGIWLQFSWGAWFREGRRLTDNELVIAVRPGGVAEHDPLRVLSGDEPIEITWAPGERLAYVGERVADVLRQRGMRAATDWPDWSLAISSLQRSLDVALPANDDAWHLRGALYELVGEDWAVTDRGLEH